MKLDKNHDKVAEELYEVDCKLGHAICIFEVAKDSYEFNSYTDLLITMDTAIQKLKYADEKISLMYKFQ